MNKALALEAFYDQHQLDFPSGPATLSGHFNVFERNRKPGPEAGNIPYSRKDFYKICLLTGRNRILLGDRIIDTEKNALLFINPRVPYGIEVMEKEQSGFFCLFSGSFISNSAIRGNQLGLLEKDCRPLFDLTDHDAGHISGIYSRMQLENNHNFKFKNELIRSLIVELALSALKISKAQRTGKKQADQSLPALFSNLLEAQFPNEPATNALDLRSPAAFAEKLSVHLNHLNKTLKGTYGKTTGTLITERTVQEAKRMLARTSLNISEIAWSLGFNELSYFNQVFKKVTRMTPKNFRERCQV
ncbi:helix-turn-helix transcriptional regulator [Mucilaginibacter sp. BJC16-A38]|uniref:helix-turn-helix domain-containing protein n=1 Tax=Mucilaginibacter phenanthrenivorans TaxID=1234842 RepID=UPI002157136F|nr:AraC family transcriptional regulator [Mucilaginibacter phenanthrenivorans]MCR8557338.1 helix-turn-helix transcriptional regulator [Mucilaginibacter phenanthrenivorans]